MLSPTGKQAFTHWIVRFNLLESKFSPTDEFRLTRGWLTRCWIVDPKFGRGGGDDRVGGSTACSGRAERDPRREWERRDKQRGGTRGGRIIRKSRFCVRRRNADQIRTIRKTKNGRSAQQNPDNISADTQKTDKIGGPQKNEKRENGQSENGRGGPKHENTETQKK